MRSSNRGERRGHRHSDRGHPGDRKGHRGGRRRVLDGGQLRLLLLTLLTEQERHGYDLIREIEARNGGAYAPSPGVVYPTLTLLLDMGLIAETESEGARKLFTVTGAGTEHLDEHAEDAEATIKRIEALAEHQEKVDPAPVRRAMDNLKTALQNRLSEEGVDKETIFAVAALVDEAAGKIERL